MTLSEATPIPSSAFRLLWRTERVARDHGLEVKHSTLYLLNLVPSRFDLPMDHLEWGAPSEHYWKQREGWKRDEKSWMGSEVVVWFSFHDLRWRHIGGWCWGVEMLMREGYVYRTLTGTFHLQLLGSWLGVCNLSGHLGPDLVPTTWYWITASYL